MKNTYEDIINMPHPEPRLRQRMPRIDRAAQFSPFAALNGYDDAVKETARTTNEKRGLAEEAAKEINEKLVIIRDNVKSFPMAKIVFFVPDKRKEGGEYVPACGRVLKLKEFERKVVMQDGTEIPIDDIIEIILPEIGSVQ